MRNPERHLDEAGLYEDLQERTFAPSAGPPHVGLEVEILAFRGIQAVPVEELLDAISPLMAQGVLTDVTTPGMPRTFEHGPSRLTFEPGGQLELVTPPRPSTVAALNDIAGLEALLDPALCARRIRRANHGVNPWQDEREIDLQTPEPRYVAMQEYFRAVGPDGHRMMRLTCALQINLDCGTKADMWRRWRLANLMSPVLIGMFANSPMAGGRLTGWKSSRAAIWFGVDPSRTAFHLGVDERADNPGEYLAFALDAGVLLRRTPGGYVPGIPSFTFRDWMKSGDDLGFPTLDDWHYHLTTLFPPVRPRGFLELRAMDNPPVRWRTVPVAVATALLLDPQAREASIERLAEHGAALSHLAIASSRHGLAHPVVQSLARQLMDLARDAFDRLPHGWLSPSIVADVEAFRAQYTDRGRCPADELLDLQSSGRDAAGLARAAASREEELDL